MYGWQKNQLNENETTQRNVQHNQVNAKLILFKQLTHAHIGIIYLMVVILEQLNQPRIAKQ